MPIQKASSSKSKRKKNPIPPQPKGKKSVKYSEGFNQHKDDVGDVEHIDVEEDMQEDLYGEETPMCSDDYDAFAEKDDDSSDEGTFHREENVTILSEDDIRQRQQMDVMDISSVLSLSKEWASLLLHHHDWNTGKVHEVWFADEEKVRSTVGLVEKPVVHYSNDEKLTCGICFEIYYRRSMYAAGCGHPFCTSCWEGYIGTSINDGPGCLNLRCPDPSCGAAVGQDMVNVVVSDQDKEKYSRFLLRSYVEANKNIKWCPAPGCEYAVEFEVGSRCYDVTCKCANSFCWNCLEEIHRPVDCDTVAKWILKNTAESENVTWLIVNSKPCPKCKRPIEKNHGCMHMTCTPPCSFQFCWLCLGAWSDHGRNSGGFYACNTYEAAKKEGAYEESEQKRLLAKKFLERYTHYYERWAANQSSRQKAMKDLQRLQEGDQIEKLRVVQCQMESQLKFITDAWLQIIECRRVLKWTYAYGYFLPEHEHVKRQLFEYLQGEAENGLERLHKCAEIDLKEYLDARKPLESFNGFRSNLAGLTSVTRNYFENLVRALENGLADVDSGAVGSSEGTEGNSKAKKGKGKSKKETTSISWVPEDDLEHQGSWTCEHCTYYNGKAATVCQMCNRYRVSWACGYCTYLNDGSATVCGMCNQAR